MILTLVLTLGTVSNLLEVRTKDESDKGLTDWMIKTVHFWGETTIGTWKLDVRANVRMDYYSYTK